MAPYNAEKIEFPNIDQASLVEKELRIIRILREKTNLSDPNEARKLLKECKAKNVFKTKTGINFLDSLEQTANINTKNEQRYTVYNENNGLQKKNNTALKIIVIVFIMLAIAAVAVVGIKIKSQIDIDNLSKIIGVWEFVSQNNETEEYITSGYKVYAKCEFKEDGKCLRNLTSYIYLDNKIDYLNDETKIEMSTGTYNISGNKIIINFDSRIVSKVKTEGGKEVSRELREMKRNLSYTYSINDDRLVLVESDGNENIYYRIKSN